MKLLNVKKFPFMEVGDVITVCGIKLRKSAPNMAHDSNLQNWSFDYKKNRLTKVDYND